MNYSDKPSAPFQYQSWVHKKGFSHWAAALLWLVFIFIVSQIVVALVAIAVLLITGAAESPQDLAVALENRLDILFIGNSAGQILCLGLATFLVVALHRENESKTEFLRLQWDEKTPLYLLLGAVLMVVIQPTVMFLGYLNSLLPVPEVFSEFQQSQYQMFEDFLTSDGVMWFGLFHIALVPAFAEEILFRGYVLRAFEKSWGIVTAVIVSSLVFGLFHLQLNNLLPLMTLGGVMGLVTWLSGSLWPAMLAHFINNGSAVIMANFYPDQAFAEMTLDTMPPVWMLLVSIVLTVILVKLIFSNSKYSQHYDF